MNGTITINDAQEKQIQWKYAINKLSSSTKPKDQNEKDQRDLTLLSINELLQRQMLINAFKSGLFPINQHKEEDSKY